MFLEEEAVKTELCLIVDLVFISY